MLAPGGDDYGEKLGVDIKDMFIDGRSQDASNETGAIQITCDPVGECENIVIDRVTTLRRSTSDPSNYSQSGSYALFTNVHECTTPGSCPDFYTGTNGGDSGSRACFEYEDGTLTSTPLWPWRMDDRIKAALAYDNALGLGASPLAGSSGTGYAAGTVTSEIVSRYGAIPSQCLREGGSFVPDFPVSNGFPATGVLDTFDRPNGAIGSDYTLVAGVAGFNVSSNVAVANANHQRVLWDTDSFDGAHEAHVVVPTVPADGTGATVVLIFGADALEDTGWHLHLGRPSGSNDTLTIARIAGGYTEILGPIDLGTEVLDNNAFGVRVDPPNITVFWRYDGIWYEVDSVTDVNLPAANVYIGTGAVTGESRNDLGGGNINALDAPTNLRLLD
jgi:hypothetical protein